ncbi:MAG: sigma-70 family RNA polymerase sigma factor [Nannocystaceae bacterium]|nr:sigma-70 family RNA polymerase sigma factor [Nannocystaceae bacterium]
MAEALDLDPTAHTPLVRRALRSLGVEPEALDDAMQDVFTVIVRRAADFDRGRSLVNWIWGIARGVASTHRRARRRRAALVHALAGEPAPQAPAPDDALAHAQAAGRIADFVCNLPAIHRDVFVRAELQGRAGPEIAAELGLNLNTTYARIRAVRARFERELLSREPESLSQRVLRAFAPWFTAVPGKLATMSATASMVAMVAVVPHAAIDAAPTIALPTIAIATAQDLGEPAKDAGMKSRRTNPAAHATIALALAAAPLSVATTAAAAPAKAKRATAARTTTDDGDADEAARKDGSGNITAVYDFVEGDRLTGEVIAPTGANIDARRHIKFPSLLTLRGHFLPELIQVGRDL